MTELFEKKCVPCSGGVPPLAKEEKKSLMAKISAEWALTNDDKKLFRSLKTKDWAQAMSIANKISDVAEEQMHHPDLKVTFGQLDIEIWTHKIGDLVESDFILASKVDQILDS